MKKYKKCISILLIFTITLVFSSYGFANNNETTKMKDPKENSSNLDTSINIENDKEIIKPKSLSTIGLIVGIATGAAALGKTSYDLGKYTAKKAISKGLISKSSYKSSRTLRISIQGGFIGALGPGFGFFVNQGFSDYMYGH